MGVYRDHGHVRASVAREERRVERLLRKGRTDREAEAKRSEAEQAIANGFPVDPQLAVVPPTSEWLEKGEVVPYRVGSKRWTDRTVVTPRRRMFDAVRHLEARCVLDEAQAKAARWFQRNYEIAGLEPGGAVSGYGEAIQGEVAFGHVARTESMARARQKVRWALSLLPDGSAQPFMAVIVDNLGLDEAARRIKRRPSHTRLMVVRACSAIAAELDEQEERP